MNTQALARLVVHESRCRRPSCATCGKLWSLGLDDRKLAAKLARALLALKKKARRNIIAPRRRR